MKDWDDLRFFLALARDGTVSGAARILSVNYTTVIRRLNQLEEKTGLLLFDRSSNRYMLTAEGSDLLQRSTGIEEAFVDLERQLSGKDQRLSGVIRFDTTEHIAALLMDDLSEFAKLNPAIELQIITNLETINLSKRDADIALRVTNSPPDYLLCRQMGSQMGANSGAGIKVTSQLYGSHEYLENFPLNASLSEFRWIGWDQNYAGGTAARIMENAMPAGAKIACRVNSSASFNCALAAGLGIGYMWCFLADKDSRLRKVNPELPALSLGLWLILHKDLAQVRRLQVFSDFIETALLRHFSDEN